MIKPLVALPPAKAKQHLLQAHLDAELYEVVKSQAKQRGMNMKQVVIWSLQVFLAHADPEAAAKLGIKVEQ